MAKIYSKSAISQMISNESILIIISLCNIVGYEGKNGIKKGSPAGDPYTFKKNLLKKNYFFPFLGFFFSFLVGVFPAICFYLPFA